METLTEIDRTTGSVYLLRDLIQERLGLALDDVDGIRLITNHLAGRLNLRHCNSFLAYYYLLMSASAAAQDEWRHLMAVLAKSTSNFWRHSEAVRTLIDVALPRLLAKSPHGPLRIWSASCATGEEPLSIAMALNEAGWFKRVQIEIRASDASHIAIESAMHGLYSEARGRELDANLRDKYFTREPGGWRVVPDLRKMIEWKVANLMCQDEVANLAQSDVIFCRKVFIYFTGHAICKTLRLFGQYMPPGAFLFSDRGDFFTGLISSSNLFEPVSTSGSDVWIRRDIG